MDHMELIERYIYAVTKHIKKENREDIAKELHSIIEDMLEERCQGEQPTTKDVQIVLTELGTPRELYEKYNSDGVKCLIGEPYYTAYCALLKIVLACVIFGMLVANLMSMFMEPTVWYMAIAEMLASIMGGVITAFGFVTIIMAMFYRKGIKMDSLYDSLDNLPPVPKKNEKISRKETIFGISISIIFVIVFLLCPQVFCAVFTESGTTVPVFNLEHLHTTWYFIIIFAAIGIARDFVKLIDGSYTNRVLRTTIVADICSAVLSIVWLSDDKIMNPDFISAMSKLFGEETFMTQFFGNFNRYFLIIVLFALILDIGTTIVKNLKR